MSEEHSLYHEYSQRQHLSHCAANECETLTTARKNELGIPVELGQDERRKLAEMHKLSIGGVGGL
jgi:hypothetical protein